MTNPVFIALFSFFLIPFAADCQDKKLTLLINNDDWAGINAYIKNSKTAEAFFVSEEQDGEVCLLSLLEYAVFKDQIETVKKILTFTDAQNRFPKTKNCIRQWGVLVLAIQNENEAMIDLLLEHNANVYFSNEWGEYPITAAAQAGNNRVIKELINRAVFVSATNEDKKNALMLAAEQGHSETVRLLLDHLKLVLNNSSSQGHTALMLAAIRGHKEVVELLIESEAPGFDKIDVDNKTALDWALSQKHTEIAQLIAEKQAQTPEGMASAAASAIRYHNKKLLTYLLDKGLSANALDAKKTPLLFLAIEQKAADIINLLIEKGAETSATNGFGEPALVIAIRNDDSETAKLLIDKGADVNAKNRLGDALLVLAARNKSIEIARLLINNNANVNATNTLGTTALLVAARQNSQEIVDMLLAAGADSTQIVAGRGFRAWLDEEEVAKGVILESEEMPRFPGCEDDPNISTEAERKSCASAKLLTYIYEKLTYPDMARNVGIEGTAVISFVVNTDGSVSDIEVLRDPGGGLGKEAERVVLLMAEETRWRPGSLNGDFVRVKFNLPVRFKLK